jgi:hypothetical protein
MRHAPFPISKGLSLVWLLPRSQRLSFYAMEKLSVQVAMINPKKNLKTPPPKGHIAICSRYPLYVHVMVLNQDGKSSNVSTNHVTAQRSLSKAEMVKKKN